jgi:hypothetical protein
MDLKISMSLKLSLRFTSFSTLFTNFVTLELVSVVLFFAMILSIADLVLASWALALVEFFHHSASFLNFAILLGINCNPFRNGRRQETLFFNNLLTTCLSFSE